jgi:tetratricopeptide (TPR) repeat protein
MRTRIVVALFYATVVALAAGAQGSWTAHTNAGEYAFARGDLDRAESEFRAALEIAQRLPAADRRLETSLENLARLYEHESDFDRAQPLFQLLLAAKEHRLGADNPALLSSLYAVARVSQPMGDLPTVVSSLERFAVIAETSGKADPRQYWQVLQMLARMQTVQEKPDQALKWQRRAAEAIADDRGATSEERIHLLVGLAEMELVAENGPAAERIYVEVAELRKEEDEADAFPDTMADGAETALNAAAFETAERLAMRATHAHPNAKAELKARRVLAELSWIKVNRGTSDMENLLAAADANNKELVRARDRLRALIALEGADKRTTLTRLAQVEALRGQPASAADWQFQLLEIVADDTEAAAAARRDLVTLLAAAGRFDEALAENAAVLADLETQYGPTDKRLLPVLSQRQALYESAGNKKQAKKIRKRIKKLSRQ